MTQDSLTKAIAALGAIEVAPGRYAWQPNQEDWRCWRVTDERNLVHLAAGNGLDDFRIGEMMPPWWTPQTQYRGWVPFSGAYEYDSAEKALFHGCVRVVTADLVTGEEVPA